MSFSFVEIPSLFILRKVQNNLLGRLPKCLFFWWDFGCRAFFRRVFLFFWGTLFFNVFFLSFYTFFFFFFFWLFIHFFFSFFLFYFLLLSFFLLFIPFFLSFFLSLFSTFHSFLFFFNSFLSFFHLYLIKKNTFRNISWDNLVHFMKLFADSRIYRITISIYIYDRPICIMVRAFVNGAGDWGSILGQVIPKTRKMLLDSSLLNTQHYKV